MKRYTPTHTQKEAAQPKKRSLQHTAVRVPTERDVSSNNALPKELQTKMESSFGHDFSTVAIHKNSRKALELNSLAFTQGEHIHFAPGQFNPNTEKGKNLIGHEFTHVAQQRSRLIKPTRVMGKGLNLNDDKALEQEADNFGRKAVSGENISKYRSTSLGIRNTLRPTAQAKNNVIQRNIKGDKELGYGKMEVDFTKNDATAKGASASETGWVRFHPNNSAPESNEIRLIQVARVIDTSGATTTAGDPWKFSQKNNEFRNKTNTASNAKKNIAGGFHVDILPGGASPRTKKSDSPVLPFYNAYATGATGKRKGTTKVSATLWDGPGHFLPIKYNFVTSAKAHDTGTWYGTVLWGFEIYLDSGKAKIKNEYKRFREYRGATTDAAIEKFNEYFKNPGTSGAPTK